MSRRKRVVDSMATPLKDVLSSDEIRTIALVRGGMFQRYRSTDHDGSRWGRVFVFRFAEPHRVRGFLERLEEALGGNRPDDERLRWTTVALPDGGVEVCAAIDPARLS